ncbi:MAG: HAMP domain-containing histidine kinase [Elusimicrobia bacterium]|nr:HAMP domain-containing histidine kinase [Elusimicrobiota bacterium]
MSIRSYVFLILLALIAWQFLLFGATFYYVQYDTAVENVKKSQDDTLEKLVTVCRESAMRTSPFAAINYMTALAKDPVISFALCSDFNGRILAHTDTDLIGGYLPRDSKVLLARARGFDVHHDGKLTTLEIFSPVMVQARRAGVVSIGYDAVAMEATISRSLWNVLGRLGLVSCGTLFVVLLTAVPVARRLTGPITELAKGAKEIAAGHLEYKVPVESGRSDELRILIEEFNKMAARLKEVEKLKERFLASVTHDLRAPLVGIQGHTELLMNQDLSEESAKHVETIYYSSQLLSHFISDILDLSRLEAGAMELKRVKLNLKDVVSSCLELMGAKSEEYKIKLDAEVPENLPLVSADHKLVHRVLNNLVSNALKFTPEGGRVVVRTICPFEHPEFVRIEVADTGPGIPQAQLESVFEKFFQVEETREAARSEGTGLGLAIAKEIVAAHGGRIWVESKPGDGTRFFFTLPVA